MGQSKPKIAGLKPIKQDIPPGIYAFCTCGWSSNQPFCDGSHQETSFKPIKMEITTQQKISWCNCKRSSKLPFCDNTHENLLADLEDNRSPHLP